MQQNNLNPLFSTIGLSGAGQNRPRSVSPIPGHESVQQGQFPQFAHQSPPQMQPSAMPGSNLQPQTSAFGFDLSGEARNTARALMQKFDVNRSGYLEGPELENMIREVHSLLQVSTGISNSDVQAFGQILDLNRDGRVCLNDVEGYVMKLLK